MIVFMATIRARPELADTVAAAMQQLAVQTRTEAGCLRYDVHRSLEDPTLLLTVEEWRSEEDIGAHFAMPYVAELVAQAPNLLSAEPIFQKFTRLE